MWQRLDVAAADLHDLPPAELFARFLGWTHPPHASGTIPEGPQC